MPLRFLIKSNHPTLAASAETKEFAACGGTIGRNSNNDWVLADDSRYVSGQHALIDFQAGAYYLIDTSRNGVYINRSDEPVGRGHPQRLFDGDRLKIGDYDIEIKITADDPALLHDGMRDSVVRAQLVPIEDSLELPLLENAQLATDKAPAPLRKASQTATERLAKAQAIKAQEIQ
ncbi:MAG: FHA domain-containing protein, partial [Gammaproteobacteria bacterium]|nr:FHA domain-containing protein [Gammaproteobacteria bacterium]